MSNLQHVDPEFLELFDHTGYNEVVAHILGEETNAIIFTAPFHLDGMLARDLHTDTWWMPPPQNRHAPPKMRVGDVTRNDAYNPDFHADSEWITPCMRVASIWMLSDFSYENGATMIMPGSHLSGRHPTDAEGRNSGVHLGAIPLEGPAGTLVIYDARMWHQSGYNQGTKVDPVLDEPWRLC